MNIYENAIERAVTFWTDVFEKSFGEKLDPEAIKARYEELRLTHPEQFEAEYGPEEMLKQERRALRRNNG